MGYGSVHCCYCYSYYDDDYCCGGLPGQIALEQFGASRGNIVMSDASQDNQLVMGCRDVSIHSLLILLFLSSFLSFLLNIF